MATASTDVELLFEKLSTAIKSNQHKKALKLTDDILKLSPGDDDALKCKVVALINIADYDAVVKTIPRSSKVPTLLFYKAYSLYKLSKFEDALAAVKEVPVEEPGALELEAQLHYKLGNNTQCIESYKRLLEAQQAGSNELKANVIAAYVAGGRAAEVPGVMSSLKATSKQSFDIGFNRVCALIEGGQYPQAETELRQVLKLARETLLNEDDMTEEEVEQELAPIIVQLGFVLGRQGKLTDAAAQYERVVKGEHADGTIHAVALNNSITDGMRGHAGTHQKKFCSTALKKLDALLDKADSTKLQAELEVDLSPQQKLTLHLNRALLAILAGRTDQAAQIMPLLVKQHASSSVFALVQASVLAKSSKVAEADALLAEFAKSTPADADQATLMRVQLALESGNQQVAMQLLGSMQKSSLHTAPAVLATRGSLHELAGDVAGAEALLQQSLSSLKGEAKEHCLQHLVDLKLRLGKTSEAAEAYQQLRASGADSSSAQVLAKLARATAALEAGSTQAYAADLPKPQQISERDLDQLEEQMSAAAPAKVSKKRDADGDVNMEQKTKKHKKKKPRFPKGFDPANPGPLPDPERWMPKWQRAGQKKSRRRRDGNAVKGSQGAGKVDENLDRTKPMEVDPKETKPAAASSSKGRSGKGKGKR